MWHVALISYFSASLDVLGVNVVRPHSSTVHLDLCPRVHLARKFNFYLNQWVFISNVWIYIQWKSIVMKKIRKYSYIKNESIVKRRKQELIPNLTSDLTPIDPCKKIEFSISAEEHPLSKSGNPSLKTETLCPLLSVSNRNYRMRIPSELWYQLLLSYWKNSRVVSSTF